MKRCLSCLGSGEEKDFVVCENCYKELNAKAGYNAVAESNDTILMTFGLILDKISELSSKINKMEETFKGIKLKTYIKL